jgi:hypothetical protein
MKTPSVKDPDTADLVDAGASVAIKALILIAGWLMLVRVSGWLMGTAFAALAIALGLSLDLHNWRKKRKREQQQSEETKKPIS